MKGKRVIGLLFASALVLSGCSSSGSEVKEDGKYVVASITDKNIYADDLYDNLLATPTGQNAVFNYVLQQVIDTYYPVDSDMKEYADTQISNVEAYYEESYGDDYESYLESALAYSGYDDMDAYNDALLQSLQYSSMVRDYVKDNFDTLFEDYYNKANPHYISLIKVSIDDFDNITTEESEKLEEVEALLKTDKDFGEIAYSYSDDEDTAASKGELGLVDTTSELSSTYGSDVEDSALSLKEGKRSKRITGDDGYYFLLCTSTDKDQMKEELENVTLTSPLLSYDDYIIYDAFETYEIEYPDEQIEKIMSDFMDDVAKTRAESED